MAIVGQGRCIDGYHAGPRRQSSGTAGHGFDLLTRRLEEDAASMCECLRATADQHEKLHVATAFHAAKDGVSHSISWLDMSCWSKLVASTGFEVTDVEIQEARSESRTLVVAGHLPRLHTLSCGCAEDFITRYAELVVDTWVVN